MKKVFLILTILTTTMARAQGSLSREDVLAEVCSENRSLCTSLKALNISAEGLALRLGKQFPNGSERIMPYTFTANQNQNIVTIDRDEAGRLIITVQ